MQAIQLHAYEDFSYTQAGVAVACDVEYSGYDDYNGSALIAMPGGQLFYSLSFTMTKTGG